MPLSPNASVSYNIAELLRKWRKSGYIGKRKIESKGKAREVAAAIAYALAKRKVGTNPRVKAMQGK